MFSGTTDIHDIFDILVLTELDIHDIFYIRTWRGRWARDNHQDSAESQGEQGDDPEKGSARESRVMFAAFGHWRVSGSPVTRYVTYPLRWKGQAMVAVREIPWEEASAPGFETTTRQAWREAVAEIAEKARAKLPECSGRVDSAVKIVLAGDVELMPDGTARVASQSSSSTTYHIVNGHCDCRDYEKAPHQFCKHRVWRLVLWQNGEIRFLLPGKE
jgi:hypothetical protein